MNIEQQPEDQLKAWWKENWRTILLTLVLTFTGIYGWQYYNNHQETKKYHALTLYKHAKSALTHKNWGQLHDDYITLTHDYPHSPYTNLTAFLEAKSSIDQAKTPQAASALHWIIDHNDKKSPFTQVAILRLARLQLTNEQPRAALDLISTSSVQDSVFSPMAYEVMADAYLDLNDKQKAQETLKRILQSKRHMRSSKTNQPNALNTWEQMISFKDEQLHTNKNHPHTMPKRHHSSR